MSVYYGIIRDHVVVLPREARVTDGQRVEVRVAAGQPAQGRVLVEVTGKPLSQTIIEERRPGLERGEPMMWREMLR